MVIAAERYFTTKLVGDGTWSINGPANDLMYLITGSEKALLVDTGMGIGDLAGLVKRISDLPLIVVNTHGHPDHAGGNSNFTEVWSSLQDETIMRTMCSDEFRIQDIQAVLGEQTEKLHDLMAGLIHAVPFQLRPLQAGQYIDLGNRQFEVIGIPGHTPGSIGLLNEKERVLFSGDSIVATPAWLYLKHSLSLNIYLQALKRVMARSGTFETIYPGHQPTPLGLEYLSDLIACAEEILVNPDIGEPVRTFAGEGLCWAHGKGQIIYNPENLI